jgi:uncharacterized membrane protein (DUF106 family)
MEYTSLFEPMIIIFISLLAGIILGSLSMIYIGSRELKETKEELDKFRDLYFEEVRVNSLIDSKTRTGALAN